MRGCFDLSLCVLFFQIIHHGLRIRYFKRICRAIVHEAWFDEHLLDDAVVDKHAVAPGTVAKAEIGFLDEHAHFFREVTITVRKHEDFFDLQVLGPLEHHEGIVDGKTNHFVDAELFEIVVEGLVAGSVDGGAGRREGARQGKEHDLFTGKNVGRAAVLPAIGVFPGDAFIADAGFKDDVRNAVARL